MMSIAHDLPGRAPEQFKGPIPGLTEHRDDLTVDACEKAPKDGDHRETGVAFGVG